jgi:hypothetical protein
MLKYIEKKHQFLKFKTENGIKPNSISEIYYDVVPRNDYKNKPVGQ